MPLNIDGYEIRDQDVRMYEQTNIVRSGLVLHLDASIFNTVTYGTTWFDLSGNGNNGTFVNGPTYSSDNGGVIVLDGVNDYIEVNNVDLRTSDYTIFGVARYVSIDLNEPNFSKGGRTFSAKDNNWLMGHWGYSTTKHYAEGWVTDTSFSENSDLNWRLYTATQSGGTYSFYVNNSLDTSNTSGTAGPHNFSIGHYSNSTEFSNSQIGCFLVYNRLLTSNEISHNYNVTKGRFGL